MLNVLLGNRVDDVIKFAEGLLEVSHEQQTNHNIKAELVDVQRAETNIAQVSLATLLALHLHIFLSVYVALASRRLVFILRIFLEAILGVHDFVLMHDVGTSF